MEIVGIFYGHMGVNFGGSCNGNCWYILWTYGLFYGHWKYFVAIWYISWSVGIFSPVLVCCSTKNLATLIIIRPKGRTQAKNVSRGFEQLEISLLILYFRFLDRFSSGKMRDGSRTYVMRAGFRPAIS
jgi:hypothetical protein